MNVIEAIEKNGFVTLPAIPEWFTADEFTELDRLTEPNQLPTERVYLGDAGEPNAVDVGRIVTDHEEPRVATGPAPKLILDILASPSRMARYASLLNGATPVIRRAQVNTMHAGNYVGRHLDTDSNPDYEIAVILQFGRAYTGGDFVAYHATGTRRIATVAGSVTISDCRVEHEVERVQEGKRKSLVYFVSGQAGKNRRARSGE